MKPHSAPGGQSLKTEHRKKLSHFIAEKQGRNKKKEKQQRKKGSPVTIVQLRRNPLQRNTKEKQPYQRSHLSQGTPWPGVYISNDSPSG